MIEHFFAALAGGADNEYESEFVEVIAIRHRERLSDGSGRSIHRGLLRCGCTRDRALANARMSAERFKPIRRVYVPPDLARRLSQPVQVRKRTPLRHRARPRSRTTALEQLLLGAIARQAIQFIEPHEGTLSRNSASRFLATSLR